MDNYKCSICGKMHTIFRSMKVPLPNQISEMGEDERKLRVKTSDEFLVVDEKLLFANGWINIELQNHESAFFSWKTWTSISKDEFSRNIPVLEAGKIVELFGKLEGNLPFYPNSKDLRTKTLLRATNDELIVEIIIQEDSQLKEDQSKPITEKRMIELMQMLHHHPSREVKRETDKSFKERLLEELNYSEQKYFKTKEEFFINISSNSVLFQIVNNIMLENRFGSEHGFGLHLSFDETINESKEEISRFREQEYSKDFKYIYLDEVPTYQIDLGNDKQKLIALVERIVSQVYKENINEIEVESMEV